MGEKIRITEKTRKKLSNALKKAWKEGRRKLHPNTLNNFRNLNKGKFGDNHPSGGDKHPAWKGNNVGYQALHNWIKRRKGTPEICENCGKSGLRKQQIHWANKSGKYLRMLDDWIRLCAKCHCEYDQNYPPLRTKLNRM